MNNYREIIEKINYTAFLGVVALLPFPQLWLRYACVLWIATWALEGRWLTKPKPIRENLTVIPFILFGLWFGWKALSGFWVEDHGAWAWYMERYMTFALMVPVGIWGVNERYDWRQIGKVFVLSCFIAIPFYLILVTTLYYHREIIDFFHWQGRWNYSWTTWFDFFSDNISVIKHRLFLCSVEMLGAVIALQIWKDKKWFLAACLPVMLSSIPLTGSRQSILTLAALLTAWFICSLPAKARKQYSIGIVLLGIILGGVVLKFHPRMSGFDIRDITELREVNKEHDVRFNIWGCALQHPEDYIRYGLGAGQSTNYLMEIYREKGFDYYVAMNYHPHNQYLEELMEIGLAGLVLFILAWLSIPICASGENRKLAILFVVLFMVNMTTDCMFGKFDGIALWAVGMVLIYRINHADTVVSDPPTLA